MRARTVRPALLAPTRRSFLAGAGAAGLALSGCAPRPPGGVAGDGSADVTLRAAPHTLELAPGVTVRTLAYNDRAPGPLIRLPAKRLATIDVVNATDADEIAHWHGLYSPSHVDGAVEEGTPAVPPGEARRYVFEPRPSGTHWYHTHAGGGANLSSGGYSGLFGMFIVEDGADPGAYDHDIPVVMHHWDARWVDGRETRTPRAYDNGMEIAYRHATMNDRLLGHGEPIRVREGDRALFRIVNASGTELTMTELAGHEMRVVAMDGVATPKQHVVSMLALGPGERADVVVEMNNPGVWILGSAFDADRAQGMGLVVEYAGHAGEPRWERSGARGFDYMWFANAEPAPEPDAVFDLALGQIGGGVDGHNVWTINGKAWPDTDLLRVREGGRYRLRIRNQTNVGHPMHLHRHHFEVTRFLGRRGSGLKKDTVNVRPHSVADLDFVADNPGPTLFHCHQTSHMEAGLMALLLYDGDQERMGIDDDALREMLRNSMCLPSSTA